jgi:hypothetical protein
MIMDTDPGLQQSPTTAWPLPVAHPSTMNMSQTEMPIWPMTAADLTSEKAQSKQAFVPTPSKYISTITTHNNYTLQIVIRVTIELDGFQVTTKALIDSRATNNFIDKNFIARYGISMQEKPTFQPITLADGETSTAGVITHEVSEILNIGGLQMDTTFDVTKLGHHKIVLGMPWLSPKVHPIVDGLKRTVPFKSAQLAAFQSISARITSENQKPIIPVKEHIPKDHHDQLAIFSEKEASRLAPH